MTTREELDRLSKALSDNGLLIEAGWVGLRIASVPLDVPQVQVDEMRNAFMAGAQHLFSSIMSILDPGDEPTEADIRRLSLIDAELRKFYEETVLRLRTEGSS